VAEHALNAVALLVGGQMRSLVAHLPFGIGLYLAGLISTTLPSL
jgi:hypothetical protein